MNASSSTFITFEQIMVANFLEKKSFPKNSISLE